MKELDYKKTLIKLLGSSELDFVRALKQALPELELYVVGGVVRDAILGRPCKDIDFVARNVPIEALQEALRNLGVVNLVGKHFGVLKFTPTDSKEGTLPFDIALPRTEHCGGTGGYRDVAVQSDHTMPLIEDLSRRDFTVNTMAWDVFAENLIDEFDGMTDIKEKTIRAIGEPKDRFQDDYSRMLRALRFSVQLQFELSKNTLVAIKKMLPHINDEGNGIRVVPQETIAKEIMKSLVADPVATLDLFDSVGAWEYLMPELLLMKNCPQHPEFHSEGDVWVHTRLALQKLASKECEEFVDARLPEYLKKLARPLSPDNVVAVLLHDIAKPDTLQTPETHGVDRIRTHEHESVGAEKARAICERLKLSSPQDVGIDVDRVVYLIRNHLIAAHGAIAMMKPTTIEKYFFKDPALGADLLLMIFSDGSATITTGGIPALGVLHEMIDRINALLTQFRQKTLAMKLPKPIIDGNEIMIALNLPPSKQIGSLIHAAREAQLEGKITTKEEAIDYLKSLSET